jgi:hypothetical protein
MKQVESLSYMIDKAKNGLRNEVGEYRKATIKEKIAIMYLKARKEALKLAFAVVITECIMVVALHYGVKWGLYDYFIPKTITITMVNPVQAKEIEPQEAKTQEKTVKELLNIIHKHESSNGTAKVGLNKTCEAKGMSNEWGYNPPTCYKDNASLEKIVTNWIIDHKAQGMTDEQLLSHYSNGAYTK